MEETYIPGTCNIGDKEIAHRKAPLKYSLIVCAVLIAFIQLAGLSKGWRLLLFIPASIVAITFQQCYFKFCVSFGLRGLYNFGEVGKLNTVEQANDAKKDRAKTWQMIGLAVLFGILTTVAYYFLPE